MDLAYLPTLVSFLVLLGLGIYVFIRNRAGWVNIFFFIGIEAFALVEFGNFMALRYQGTPDALLWRKLSLMGECLLPGTWLGFSLSFSREKPWYSLKEWRLVLGLVVGASIFFLASLASNLFVISRENSALITLGPIGKAFYAFFVVSTVIVVTNLEYTIRQSKPEQRRKTRFLVLGLGGLLAFLIYLASQNLLFSQIDPGMVPVRSSVFILSALVIAFSVVRHRLMDVNLYVSRFVIYNSLTVFVVGAYLVFIGVVSQVVRSFDFLPGYRLEILFLFVAVLLFFSLLLSDRVRWSVRMFINKHFFRSRYDYRKEWLKFSERISPKPDLDVLISTTIDALRETLGVERVSMWLTDESTGEGMRLVEMRSSETIPVCRKMTLSREFVKTILEKAVPFHPHTPWAREFVSENHDILEKSKAELLVPLVSGKETVGLVLMGRKATGEEYLGDDIDLLRSASVQIAGAIVNVRLSQELVKAKELEVFHRFSSFVLHDLKNLVWNLSLVVQNAGEHMSNPDFQRDVMETVGKSVDRMEALIARLSNGINDMLPNLQRIDLKQLVSDTVSRMVENGQRKNVDVSLDLEEVLEILVDPEQVEKVVVNLLLNAYDALPDTTGRILVTARATQDDVILSVSDNGAGMKPEFVRDRLFKPFSSTKNKGLGIGLYQCKAIVEAHEGRIEVETEEGVGTTFRVILPFRLGPRGRGRTIDRGKREAGETVKMKSE
jgi:putative PEP-CTERM system histidine kinase